MKIYDVKINGIREPLGFELPYISLSWKVKETESRHAAKAAVTVAADEAFTDILVKKEGPDLCSVGEVIKLTLCPRTRYFVRIRVVGDAGDSAEAESFFETGKLGEAFTAHWIGTQPDDCFHPLFFRDFSLKSEPVSARLYVTGLGLYEAFLNAVKVGNDLLAPFCNDYNDAVQVQTYDVTDVLHIGENHMEILCGNGWYKGRLGYDGAREVYGTTFSALAELHIRYTDGTEEIVNTDEQWQYRGSDFETSDIYDGECLNRLLWQEKPNVSKPVTVLEDRKTADRYSLPVVVKDSLPVREIITTPAGETVLDFGQNFTGYVEYTADFPSGTRITLDHGEILQNGNFYNDNYRTAKVQMIYVSDGRKETVCAHFTYFGFRYVRVTGWPGELYPEDFVGRVVYSDLDTTISFQSSDEKLNRLAANAFWGQRSNFLDMPTDCPQRDERLGWTGDAQVFSPTACFQMDTRAFYRKFLKDLRLDQVKHDGVVANYMPNFAEGMPNGSSVWGDVASFLPITLFDCYGDRQALAEQYPLMHDWLEWIIRQDEEHGGKHLWNFGFHFGDWLAQDGVTPQSMKGGTDDFFVASMYYYASAQKLARAAQLLGKATDAERYEKLSEQIRDAILYEYFSASGRLCIDTQTAYLLCLNFGVYRDKQVIIEYLKKRLQKDCWKIKGGFVGATMMCRVLAENGMEDLAAYFLFQEGFPGWMHCVNLGATTIWERWNSVLDDGTISGTGMNSLNHYSYGSVMEYVFRDLAGIRSLTPGFTRVRFAPQPTCRLQELSVSYDSASGVYTSHWRVNEDGTLSVRFEVPFGCTASAELPDGETVELEAGVFEKTYTPQTDYRLKYNWDSRLSELADDPEALAVLREDLPPAIALLESGDAEFLGLSMKELQFLFFRGFNPPLVQAGTKRLFALKSF